MMNGASRATAPGRSRAFTLIETLVVVGIVAILAGLLMPAVQAARETARRIRCASNLRNLATASQHFASTFGGLPPEATFTYGKGPSGERIILSTFSPQVRLLPYLEQQALHDQINFDAPLGSPAHIIKPARPVSGLVYPPPFHLTVGRTRIDVFLCPSDPLSAGGAIGPNSYRANTGAELLKLVNGVATFVDDGPFVVAAPGRVAPLSSVTDGLSATVMFSEKPIGSEAAGGVAFSPFRDYVLDDFPGGTADHFLVNCSRLGPRSPWSLDAGATWMIAGAGYTHFHTSAPPNSPIPDCGKAGVEGVGLFTARSHHPGGVQAAMADGSVRFVKSSIDPKVWRALGTRAGGEAIPSDW